MHYKIKKEYGSELLKILEDLHKENENFKFSKGQTSPGQYRFIFLHDDFINHKNEDSTWIIFVGEGPKFFILSFKVAVRSKEVMTNRSLEYFLEEKGIPRLVKNKILFNLNLFEGSKEINF